MKKLLIIKCGDTLPALVARRGDFEDWIIAGTGLAPEQTITVNVEKDEPLPQPDQVSGVIISGSHAMVTEHRPWSEQTATWLTTAVGQVPILGICYGHQLLGYALGGTVADNPHGREMGTVRITFTPEAMQDNLIGGFTPTIDAQVSHKQSLLELPPGALLLGSSARDPHQAFRYGDQTWGVQFHPEFDADIAAEYVDYCADLLRAEGQDPISIRQSCTDSVAARSVLKRFGKMISQP